MKDTPAARWREDGQSDPQGDNYNCQRKDLCNGSWTDDELANEVFLSPGIGNLTAAKERIRWLSRQLETTKDDLKDAISRIKDMLLDDDGQAYKEAEKFLELLEKKNNSE